MILIIRLILTNLVKNVKCEGCKLEREMRTTWNLNEWNNEDLDKSADFVGVNIRGFWFEGIKGYKFLCWKEEQLNPNL